MCVLLAAALAHGVLRMQSLTLFAGMSESQVVLLNMPRTTSLSPFHCTAPPTCAAVPVLALATWGSQSNSASTTTLRYVVPSALTAQGDGAGAAQCGRLRLCRAV